MCTCYVSFDGIAVAKLGDAVCGGLTPHMPKTSKGT